MAHTYRLDPQTLDAARALLDEVFGPEMRDHAWDHVEAVAVAPIDAAADTAPCDRSHR